jgi:Protein of unknown function (DUF1214)
VGLLAELPRKNCRTIAGHAGDRAPDGMRHLLSRARWDAGGVRGDVRSQIQTGQGKALLSSLFDFDGTAGADSVDLFFGPHAPAGNQDRWIQTNPGAGWFVYFRIYGPEPAAFDKTWKPGDFQPQA